MRTRLFAGIGGLAMVGAVMIALAVAESQPVDGAWPLGTGIRMED